MRKVGAAIRLCPRNRGGVPCRSSGLTCEQAGSPPRGGASGYRHPTLDAGVRDPAWLVEKILNPEDRHLTYDAGHVIASPKIRGAGILAWRLPQRPYSREFPSSATLTRAAEKSTRTPYPWGVRERASGARTTELSPSCLPISSAEERGSMALSPAPAVGTRGSRGRTVVARASRRPRPLAGPHERGAKPSKCSVAERRARNREQGGVLV